MAKRKRRNNIVLVRTDTPKQVSFVGRTFNVRFRRGKRSDLPRHITILKTKRKKKAKNRAKKSTNLAQ